MTRHTLTAGLVGLALLVTACGSEARTTPAGNTTATTAGTVPSGAGIVLPEGLTTAAQVFEIIDNYDHSPVQIDASGAIGAAIPPVTWYPGNTFETVLPIGPEIEMLTLPDGTIYQHHTKADPLMGVSEPGWYITPGNGTIDDSAPDPVLRTYLLMIFARVSDEAFLGVSPTTDGYDLEIDKLHGSGPIHLGLNDQRILTTVSFTWASGGFGNSASTPTTVTTRARTVTITYLPAGTAAPTPPAESREYDNALAVDTAAAEVDSIVQSLLAGGTGIADIDFSTLLDIVQSRGTYLAVDQESSYGPNIVAVANTDGTLHAVISDGKSTCTHLEWAADGTYTNHGPVSEGAMSDLGWTCTIN